MPQDIGDLTLDIWYSMPMANPQDRRRSSPAALRNRGPILAALRQHLPESGTVVELASGTGEHISFLARHLPDLRWQPSDPSPAARESISAWVAHYGLTNVAAPLNLDATLATWPVMKADAIICINMVHISPWEATVGLMRHAHSILPDGGLLYLYGPYRCSDRAFAPSNEAFDEDLRSRDPRWGIRDLDNVIACASEHGLSFEHSAEMPANNLSIYFRAV